MLDVRRLRLLAELAARGTVAATAEAVRLTPPAVSQQLAALEREAGVALLEKRGRTLSLTPAGRTLVAHAEVILAGLADAESALVMLRGGGLGTVRIGAFPSFARTVLPRVWAADGAPALRLTEQEPEQSIPALTRRDVDIAVVHSYSLLPRELPGSYQTTPLLTEPVLLALHPEVAAAHGLAPGASARLADFADQDWLVPGRETSCHEMVGRSCGAAGFVARTVAEATDFSVLTALVAANAGVALVPELALPTEEPGISLHPLAEPVTRAISALTRAGETRRPELARTLGLLHAAANPADRAPGATPVAEAPGTAAGGPRAQPPSSATAGE